MNITTFDHDTVRGVIRRSKIRDAFKRQRWFALFVLFPTVVAAVYYGVIASPIYVSQSSFVIKSPGQKAAPTLSLANLVQTSGLSAGQEQTKEVVQYIRSRNALTDLQRQIDVRDAYSHHGGDFMSRFPQPLHDSSFESLYHYYSSRVGIGLDQDSGLAVLQVQAFTPADAYNMNSKLLDLSESFVNKLNQRAQGREIQEDEERVAQAEERVRNARVALSTYQNQQDLVDPSKQAAGVLEVSNKLISEQAALRAQLDLMSRVTPRNPAIPALRNRVVAIGREIAIQNGRAVGTPTGITSKLASYEKLQVEQEFATQMLTAADTALETARADAQKQQFYLERVVDPNYPDTPALPHRLWKILVVFGTSLCLYFIGWMLVVGILEHSPED
jgi:capsular polysaccharide transport system permease protein